MPGNRPVFTSHKQSSTIGTSSDRYADGAQQAMTLEEFYFISQIVAAVALVASLIFVGLQVRQTDKTQRAVMHGVRADRLLSIGSLSLQPHISSLLHKVTWEPESMSRQELRDMMQFIHLMITHFDDIDWQHKAGFIDGDSARQNRAAVGGFLSTSGVRALWQSDLGYRFAPQLAARINRELIENVPTWVPTDVTPAYLQALAEIRAQRKVEPSTARDVDA